MMASHDNSNPKGRLQTYKNVGKDVDVSIHYGRSLSCLVICIVIPTSFGHVVLTKCVDAGNEEEKE